MLDPEQNHNFNDHYLEVDYDLSDVMFLYLNSMNSFRREALLDRMEGDSSAGYTEDGKKINIAVKYLAPKQISANGLKKGEINSKSGHSRRCYYTREARRAGLERQVRRFAARRSRNMRWKNVSR